LLELDPLPQKQMLGLTADGSTRLILREILNTADTESLNVVNLVAKGSTRINKPQHPEFTGC
jgi:hypothetical protein